MMSTGTIVDLYDIHTQLAGSLLVALVTIWSRGRNRD